jgi:hypothetical protein
MMNHKETKPEKKKTQQEPEVTCTYHTQQAANLAKAENTGADREKTKIPDPDREKTEDTAHASGAIMKTHDQHPRLSTMTSKVGRLTERKQE